LSLKLKLIFKNYTKINQISTLFIYNSKNKKFNVKNNFFKTTIYLFFQRPWRNRMKLIRVLWKIKWIKFHILQTCEINLFMNRIQIKHYKMNSIIIENWFQTSHKKCRQNIIVYIVVHTHIKFIVEVFFFILVIEVFFS
jgi:hypothetical protein